MYSNLISSLITNLEYLGESGVAQLHKINVGLERETLRVNPQDGTLSTKEHPVAAGSPLMHDNITTDFAETLLEFVTDPEPDAESALTALKKIQDFTLTTMEGELFWPNSMPPAIQSEEEIKIAEYGSSNKGKMSHLYRVGLSNRYGKMMQAIAGIHYNFSFKDEFIEIFRKQVAPNTSLTEFKTERYLHLCRNIARYGFVIPYFLGASPAMCKSFVKDHNRSFISLNDQDHYLPSGCSFRLSDIGYGNNKCHFDVSYNSIDEFIKNIYYAITTPCKDFSQIPVEIDGAYQQINNHILQIENEYYSSVRPKQLFGDGENFLEALKQKGIEYVELRSIDVNPLVDIGITLEDMHFIQVLMSASFLTDAPPLSQKEYEITQKNIKIVAERGKEEALTLMLHGNKVSLKEALTAITEWILPVAEHLGEPFVAAVEKKIAMITQPELTPSAQITARLLKSGLTYHQFFLKQAHQLYQKENLTLTDEEVAAFISQADESHKAQKALEEQPQIPFEEYLENYFKISI